MVGELAWPPLLPCFFCQDPLLVFLYWGYIICIDFSINPSLYSLRLTCGRTMHFAPDNFYFTALVFEQRLKFIFYCKSSNPHKLKLQFKKRKVRFLLKHSSKVGIVLPWNPGLPHHPLLRWRQQLQVNPPEIFPCLTMSIGSNACCPMCPFVAFKT